VEALDKDMSDNIKTRSKWWPKWDDLIFAVGVGVMVGLFYYTTHRGTSEVAVVDLQSLELHKVVPGAPGGI
jgi:hypothetical protein